MLLENVFDLGKIQLEEKDPFPLKCDRRVNILSVCSDCCQTLWRVMLICLGSFKVEKKSPEAVCPVDGCVLVFSYLSCLIASVSVIFKCLRDCDTLFAFAHP